ncbi:MAG: TrkA C-terminal domain-containing protein [bacterium]|nr:potassium transporter TrkA [Planctomycetota bacterium]HIL52378.1 potassium transporter TrkA [Planctomycetota bacterium]
MPALISLLIIITISYVVVRAGAVALMLTGLSAEAASFQAQSAFMGVGFTTAESESVVVHPVRRRVIRIVMLIGYVAMASVFASVMAAISSEQEHPWGEIAIWLLGLIISMFALVSLGRVRNGLTQMLKYALKKSGAVQVRDYEELLRVDKGYSISYITVERKSWMANRSLRSLRLTDEGVLVLNIVREGGVALATPGADTRLEQEDKLLCYGLEFDLSRLVMRPADYKGDSEHKLASEMHRARQSVEESHDKEPA